MKITIDVTPGQARALLERSTGTDDHEDALGAIAAALEDHERKQIGLPWEASKEPHGDGWFICVGAPGAKRRPIIASRCHDLPLTEPQARLMAAAPELSAALAAWERHGEDKCYSPALLDEARRLTAEARRKERGQ